MEGNDRFMSGSFAPRSNSYNFTPSTAPPAMSFVPAHHNIVRSHSNIFDGRADLRHSMPRRSFNVSGPDQQRGDASRDYNVNMGEYPRTSHVPMLPPLGSPGQGEYRAYSHPASSTDHFSGPMARSDSMDKSVHSSSPTHGNADPNAQGRAYRSRKDRPCDSCRRRKGRCIIEEAGMDCQSCRLNGRGCTFEMSPTPRSRPIKNEDGVTILSVVVPRKRSLSHSQKSSTQSPNSHLAEQAGTSTNTQRLSKTAADVAGSTSLERMRKSDADFERRAKLKRPTGNQGSGQEKFTAFAEKDGTDVGGDLTSFRDARHNSGDVTTKDAQVSGNVPSRPPSARFHETASYRSHLCAKGSTKELFSLITSMVQGKDSHTQPARAEAAHARDTSRAQRGPEEERGMMPMAIGSSSSEDPMLLRQAGSPTDAIQQATKKEGDEAGSINSPALSPVRRARHDTDAHRSAGRTTSADGGVFGPLQVRQVASDPHHPIFFAFVPSHPYGPNRVKGHEIGAEGLAELKESLGDKIGPLMVLYSQRDATAFPLLSDTQRREFRLAAVQALEACKNANGSRINVEVPLEPVLANATLATPTVYDQSLRPISKRAWGANLKALTEQFDISTLVTLQVALTDLTGRPSINTSGNFMSFCQTLAISQMLGLHLDCTGWNMPLEEKDVRIRLWWAIVIHDKWSSLCWGRPSMIHAQDYTVPLPRRNSLSPCQMHLEDKDLEHLPFGRGWTCDRTDAHTPGDTFVGLCRLTVILAEILEEFHSIRPQRGMQRDAVATAQRIKHYFVLLEDWKDVLPPSLASVLKGEENFRTGVESIPGTRSLQLSYLGVNLLLCRAALDSVTKRSTYDASRLAPAHHTSLQGALMMVEFLESLTDKDYLGFFLHYGSHHLASCLSLLGRLCFGFSQLGDEAMLATSVATMQRLLITLSDAHRMFNWDLAELALTRSRAILPALEARIPAFPRFFLADSRLVPPCLPGQGDGPEVHASDNIDGVNGSSSSTSRLESGLRDISNESQCSMPTSQHSIPLSDDRTAASHNGVPSLFAQQHAQLLEQHRRGTLPANTGSLAPNQYPMGPGDGGRHGFVPADQGGQWLPADASAMASGPGLTGFDNGGITFDGFTGSITVDAAGVPFPLGMGVGPVDSSPVPMQNRSGGAYIVDGAASGAGHLMSGVDFDWLMTAQSYAKPAENGSEVYTGMPQNHNAAPQ